VGTLSFYTINKHLDREVTQIVPLRRVYFSVAGTPGAFSY